jgi:hypothetical protein
LLNDVDSELLELELLDELLLLFDVDSELLELDELLDAPGQFVPFDHV